MKQQYASALLIIVSVFGLLAGAKAETHGEVIVNIPHEFSVADRGLPAGTYTVSRLSNDRRAGLSIVSRDQRSSVFVLPNQFESRPGDDVKISFVRVDGMYFMRSIETLDGVYTLPLPRFALLMAKSAHAGGTSPSGSH